MSTKKISSTFAALLLILASDLAFAESPPQAWQRIYDAQGIQVDELWQEDKTLPTFRGQTIIESDPWSILAILQDTARSHEWVHRCMVSRQIERHGLTSYIIYNRTDAPWPFEDRDVVVHSRVSIPDNSNEILISIQSTTHSEAKEVKGVVRMPSLKGHYRLKMLSPSATWIEYQIDAHPGGRLPRWLARMATKDLPFKTLEGLRSRVDEMSQSQEYQATAAQFLALYLEKSKPKQEDASVVNIATQ